MTCFSDKSKLTNPFFYLEHQFIGVRPSKIACAAVILACHDFLPPVATEANRVKLNKPVNPFSTTPPNKLSPDKGYSTTSSVSSTEVTPDNFNEKYPEKYTDTNKYTISSSSDLGSSSSLNSEINTIPNQYIPNNYYVPNNQYIPENISVNRQLWDIPQHSEMQTCSTGKSMNQLSINSVTNQHSTNQNQHSTNQNQHFTNQHSASSSNQHSRSGSFSSNSSTSSVNTSRLSLRLKIQYKPRTVSQILETIREITSEQFSGVRNVIKKIGETGIHKVPVEEPPPVPPKLKPGKSSIFDQFKPNNRLSLPPNYFSTGLSQQVKHGLSPPEPIGSRKSVGVNSGMAPQNRTVSKNSNFGFVQPTNYPVNNFQTSQHTNKHTNQPTNAMQPSKSGDFQQPLQPLKRQHTSSSSQVLSSSGNSCSNFLEPQSNFVHEIENIESILRSMLPDNLNTSSDMFL